MFGYWHRKSVCRLSVCLSALRRNRCCDHLCVFVCPSVRKITRERVDGCRPKSVGKIVNVSVNVNHQFIYRITAKVSNALNTLVSGKEERFQS